MARPSPPPPACSASLRRSSVPPPREELRETRQTLGKLTALSTMADSYHDQLLRDSEYLRSDKRLDNELVDKLVLQLNRIYPQILSNKEAQKFRDLNVPTGLRLTQLVAHLQGKGEEACCELYRALHIHAEDVYFSLPTRVSRRETADAKGTNIATDLREKYVLNDRGPWFFLSCFSLAVGVALLYYYTESKDLGTDARKVLGFAALGLGRQASEVLISYVEDPSREQ
ncbi:caspase recruitment domain-containing protein 19 [Scleropages formosus]|uniref:Caspase recruitment domain-containing protein 19-like n=1 Tax=Scleropages formosus TaxID=113540 RepID=A0A8C9VSV5_SCLFO|nr:caspase recruitment domain-containing protein 19 [Scleropages formosus]